MKQWIVIIAILFFQETVTLNGLLFEAHKGYYPVAIITLLFIVFTIIGIVVGHLLGHLVKRKWNKGKVRTFAKHWVTRLHEYSGGHSTRFYLLLLGYFSFPYLNSFITTWLDMPFWETFWYLFFGNIIFYVTCWLLVLGVMSVIPDPLVAFVAVMALTLVFMIAMRILRKSQKI